MNIKPDEVSSQHSVFANAEAVSEKGHPITKAIRDIRRENLQAALLMAGLRPNVPYLRERSPEEMLVEVNIKARRRLNAQGDRRQKKTTKPKKVRRLLRQSANGLAATK